MISAFKVTPATVKTAGIVSLSHWTMGPNGFKFCHVFADRWEILTDANMPVEGFRSSERWTLVAIQNGQVRGVFPGCGVKAWIAAAHPPASGADVLDLRAIYGMEFPACEA